MSFQFCFASAPYVWKGVAFIFIRLGFLPAVTTCVHAKRNIDTAAAAATANVVDGGGGAPMGQKWLSNVATGVCVNCRPLVIYLPNCMRANELESERMNAVFLGHFFLMSFLLYLTLFSRFAPFLTLPVWVALIRLWAPIVQMCTHWLIGAHWFSSIELFSLVCVCVWRLWPFAHSNFSTCEMVRTAIHSTFLINTWILHENLRQSLLTGTFFPFSLRLSSFSLLFFV